MRFLILVLLALPALAGSRPSGLVKFRNDFCVCKDRAAISFGPTCPTFCKSKPTAGAELLYASFSIIQNKKFKTPREWCEKLQIFEFKKPRCALAFKDAAGSEQQFEVSFTSDSTLTSDVTNADYDRTQIMTLVETVSSAFSDSSQVVKFDNTPGLPLVTNRLKQYTCVSKARKQNFHFYFEQRSPPTPRPLASEFFCHDHKKYGDLDDAAYPRLGEQERFTAWSGNGVLFLDNDGNGVLDVYDVLKRKIQRFGGTLPGSLEIFTKLILPGTRSQYEEAGASSFSSSWIMGHFVDPVTYYSYCPDESHMNSSLPIMQALKSMLGVPTEGLYAGMRTDDMGDVVLLTESEMKAVWFYLKDGVPKLPNDATMSRYSVYFYFPVDKLDPYNRKPNQALYVVRSAGELNLPSTNALPAHDRKIGCVPKL